jgi:uncharacterized membrane protein
MQLTLFTLDGLLFFLRFLHIFAGIIWIGLLYYFNFVQGSFFAEVDAVVKSSATQKLVPRALWWFRWGAFWTFIMGLSILTIRGHQAGADGMMSSYWMNILTGGLMGTIMAANVWFIIWPNQKVVIQNAVQTATGGPAIADAAARGARSTVASRTNVLLSIPMLFYMASARHLIYSVTDQSKIGVYWALVAITVGAIEYNAIFGKTGPITTIKGVITCGFVLTAIFYAFLVFTM